MKRVAEFLCVALMLPAFTCGQETFTFNGKSLNLYNGYITRIVSVDGDSVFSRALLLNGRETNYLRQLSPEFRFLADDNEISGFSGWRVISCKGLADGHSGKGAILRLRGKGEAEGLEVSISYLLYPRLPLIRKNISVTNRRTNDIKLEEVDNESLLLNFDYVSTWVYHDFARMKHIGPFRGNWNDPVVVVHNTTQRAGIAIGNEAPGVLKRTVFHTGNTNLDAGVTHRDDDFPFRKWLKPGETWTSDNTFAALYSGTDNGFDVINSTVNDFVRLHMGVRINALKEKPLFVYDTWNPFRTFISDSLIRDVAKAAAECGIREFVIDDGWEYNHHRRSSVSGWGENYGDWLVDRNKFPNDLTAVFDYIRSLGMKPGLWISVGAATSDSKVFMDHPEWFVVNKLGKTGNLHTLSGASGFYTSCFGTDWVTYIKSKVLSLVRDHGLAYAKLDFSILTSAYINDPEVSGCYASDHPGHRDQRESYIEIYRNALKLFDDLHAEAPDLFIDCTFETAGKLQLQDYAFARHAEGNWLSNIEEPFPTGALRVRQLAWWRSPALPAGSLVIGNLPLDSKDLEFDFKSLIGTLPVMLGDPRKLNPEKRKELKKWSYWLEEMQKEYDFMSFRQDLPGFGEPSEGSWDGWSRINTDSRKGGIAGVFRQGAREDSRQVFIENLEPGKRYLVLSAPVGNRIAKLTGAQMKNKGFTVRFDKLYDSAVFEIRLLPD